MRPDISATEAVRHFSELLNNIKYRGHRYTIIRGENRRRPLSRWMKPVLPDIWET